MVRKYQGPLQPGKKSAYVRGLNKTEKKQTRAMVKRIVNRSVGENKEMFHPRVTDHEFTLSNPYIYSYLNVPVGTTDNTREGDEVYFKHLLINMDITGSVDGAVKSGRPVDRIRVMLIKWREPDYVGGVANDPSALKLFGASQLPVGTNLHTAIVDSDENKRQFKVLYDKKFTLCGDIGAMLNCDSPEKKQRRITFRINQKKYGNQKIKYDSLNPGNNAHMNGLYLMVLTDNPGGALTSGPTISVDSRLIFKE